MADWIARQYSRDEAASLCGLKVATLDVVMHRTKGLETLYSEKRKGRRWFSPKDISVLRVALDLERAGRDWGTAIAQAFQHLEHPPPSGAHLVVPVASVSCVSGRVLTGLPDPLPSSSFITVPIGRLAAEIMEVANGLAVQ
jgi:hypothetical protein